MQLRPAVPRGVAARLARALVVAVAALSIGAGKPADPKKAAAVAAAQNGADTRAERAILIDAGSGSVIFEKNPDVAFPPAGLAKLMTVAVAAREAKEGRLSLDGEFTVSEHAWRTGGAPSRTPTMFAPVNVKAKVADLFRGIMIQSANDGAIALAEGIAGSESTFAELMNKRAGELGLKATRFTNPTGRAGGDDVTTARDMATLARHFVVEYPDLYKIYGEREFTYNKIRQTNRNPVLDGAIGGDGMQVATTREVGMPIVASAQQGKQRLILVMSGSPGEKERAEDAKKLLDWGFRTFETLHLYKAGEVVGEASVFGGAVRGVKIAAVEDVDILVPRGNRDKLRGRVVYTGPLPAPVAKGARVGRLVLTRGEQTIREVPVETIEEVPVGRIVNRAVDGTRELLIGVFRR